MSSNPDHVEWAEPPTKTSTLILKICAFGAAAFVGTGLLGLLIYILFFRKGHRQRKTALREEEAKNLENGILSLSRHYGIGKVPKKKYTLPPPPQKQYIRNRAASNPDPRHDDTYTSHPKRICHSNSGLPPRRSSLHKPRTPRDPTRDPRVSWGSDVTVDIAPPPKAMTSQKVTTSS